MPAVDGGRDLRLAGEMRCRDPALACNRAPLAACRRARRELIVRRASGP